MIDEVRPMESGPEPLPLSLWPTLGQPSALFMPETTSWGGGHVLNENPTNKAEGDFVVIVYHRSCHQQGGLEGYMRSMVLMNGIGQPTPVTFVIAKMVIFVSPAHLLHNNRRFRCWAVRLALPPNSYISAERRPSPKTLVDHHQKWPTNL